MRGVCRTKGGRNPPFALLLDLGTSGKQVPWWEISLETAWILKGHGIYLTPFEVQCGCSMQRPLFWEEVAQGLLRGAAQ